MDAFQRDDFVHEYLDIAHTAHLLVVVAHHVAVRTPILELRAHLLMIYLALFIILQATWAMIVIDGALRPMLYQNALPLFVTAWFHLLEASNTS